MLGALGRALLISFNLTTAPIKKEKRKSSLGFTNMF